MRNPIYIIQIQPTKIEDYCTIQDEAEPSDPAYETIQAEHDRRNSAEEDTLFALCAYRPTDMREVRHRGDYLAEFITHGELSEEQE